MDGASLTLPRTELHRLSEAMRTVVQATGRSGEEVTRGFAGIILKRWAALTKVSTRDKAIIRARTRAAKSAGVSSHGSVFYGVTINTGRKGGDPGLVWLRTRKKRYQMAGIVTDQGNITYSWLHYAKDEWDEIAYKTGLYASNLAAQMKFAIQTIGLGRQSVVQIADTLGIDLATVRGGGNLSAAAVNKARAALASNGKHYQNGHGEAHRTAQRFFIELTNNYPLGIRAGMDRGLAAAISGQEQYYLRNLEEGVFLAASRVAKAYPFLQVGRN